MAENNTFHQPISKQIWDMKYCFNTTKENIPDDKTVEDSWNRVSRALAQGSNSRHQLFYSAMEDFKFLPAGRILAGSGTGRSVTLFNCYVMGVIPDTLDGIFDMLKEAALTMQQGGGIGYDFSTIRPKGSLVRGVEADASGPLSFMDVWDSMCKTILSAGGRRGAMMATMRCDHPDIMEFITAKADSSRLRHFNVSVQCTDEFMEAVKADALWELKFDGKVYATVAAVSIWEAIMQATYDQAEPGVLYVDRINQENNLHYRENITATNPCGEQPLPPYGACLLGSLNLTKFVLDPFTTKARVNYAEIDRITRIAIEMLDCVVDVSNFPLEAQRLEAEAKRRIGLGVTGLADLLFMCGFRYGEEDAQSVTEAIMRTIAHAAYDASIALAKAKGPCPAMKDQDDRVLFVNSGFMKRMPTSIREDIVEFGIRNTHLLSVAPTGTISLYAGNVSSGGEPVFAASYVRKVLQKDGSKTEERVVDYAIMLWEELHAKATKGYHLVEEQRLVDWYNEFMVTAQTLTPNDHLTMQAVMQKWVDSSISKTINCPVDISYEDFKAVYMDAFDSGCKGCTTYRPNDITGSVLSVDEPEKEESNDEAVLVHDVSGLIMERPSTLAGSTTKIRWNGDAYYVTFNDIIGDDGRKIPFEMFVQGQNPEHLGWIGALTRMISAVFRRGGDVTFVADELQNVFDPKGGHWVEGKYCPSMAALLGQTLVKHMYDIGYLVPPETDAEPEKEEAEPSGGPENPPMQCPECKGFNMNTTLACPTCNDCGHSKCG